MQPLQCGSQHQLANLHLSTHRTTLEQQMTRVMQPFQCDLQSEIPKHPIPTHTQAHPKQLQATVTLRQKKTDKPTAAATVAHTRYLSSSPAATLHGKTQGFVLRLPPQNIVHAKSCSHYNVVRSINSMMDGWMLARSSEEPGLSAYKHCRREGTKGRQGHPKSLSPFYTSNNKSTERRQVTHPPGGGTQAAARSGSNGLGDKNQPSAWLTVHCIQPRKAVPRMQ